MANKLANEYSCKYLYLNKITFNKVFCGRWAWFGIIFVLSLIFRILTIIYSADAGLGWDENVYVKHAEAIRQYLLNYDLAQLYKNYFITGADGYRFFPIGNPLGYALFGIHGDVVLGARIYNALMVSIGIASSSAILLVLSRKKMLSFLLAVIANISLEHNAYTIFLWTEGAQFGLLSLIILISLRPLNTRQSFVIGILLALLELTHGSALLAAVSVLLYLYIFKLNPKSLNYRIRLLAVLVLPAALAILMLALFYKPVIGEFVLITSESIPMRSLKNPPSSYRDTWKAIIRKSNEENISLSNASSVIANDYLSAKDLQFIVDRGWSVLKSSMEPDGFPQRHYSAGKWPFISADSFRVLLHINEVFYYLVYVGFILYLFSGRHNNIAFLLCCILAFKVATIFYTGVGVPRYFSAYFMTILPLSFYGYFATCHGVLHRNEYNKMFKYLAWALFIGTFVI